MPFGRQRRKERRRRRGVCISCATERSYEWYPVVRESKGSTFKVRLRGRQEKRITITTVNPSAPTICEHCLRESSNEDTEKPGADVKSYADRIDELLHGHPETLERRLKPAINAHEVLHTDEEAMLEFTRREADRTFKLGKDAAKKEYDAGIAALTARLIGELQDNSEEMAKRKLRNKRDRDDGDFEPTDPKQPPKQYARVYFNSIMQITERDMQADINQMYRSSTRTARPSQTRPSHNDHDQGRDKDYSVQVKDDVLHYDRRKFERDSTVVIQSSASAHRYTAQLVNLSNNEITLKKLDGSKSKISLSHLRSGKWTISTKS